MKSSLNIVIFDGTLETPSFIRRLCVGLVKRHQILVVGFDSQLEDPIAGVSYTSVGSAAKTIALLSKGCSYILKRFFLLNDFKGGLTMIRDLILIKRKKIQHNNLDTALALFKPDIIHCQWPSLLPWVEKYMQLSNSKIILSQRGYQNNVRAFVDPENTNYLRSIYPKIDGFHSVSKKMRLNSDKIYAHTSKIDRVVYTGFNLLELRFQAEYSKNVPLRILSIGRPHWIKGYSYALKAMALLKDSEVSFKYDIVGAKGDEELRFLLDETGLKDEVILSGRISQQEVYKKMNQASVLLIPSIEEGFPEVLVEAMAVGTPIIATNCGGVAELVDQDTGVLIPTRNPKAMADAIKIFAEKPLEAILLQRIEARKQVESRFGEAQMIEGLENLYFEVLKS